MEAMFLDWKELLTELARKIDSECQQITRYVKEEKLFESELFDPPVVLTQLTDRAPLWGKKGIYIFIMIADVNLSYQQIKEWNEKPRPSEAGLKSSLPQSILTNDCLYLGSVDSESFSLYQRFRQHFGPVITEDPHGLALALPGRSVVHGKVRAIAFPLKVEFNKNAPLILPRIERALHEVFKPKAGSSKT